MFRRSVMIEFWMKCTYLRKLHETLWTTYPYFVSIQHYIYLLSSFHLFLFQFLVQVLNTFSLWGPHEALKIILRNQKYLQHCKTAKNISLIKLLLLLLSPNKINNEDVQKLLICQNRNVPVPKSQYLIQMFKYLPHASHKHESTENFEHLLELLLFLQTPSVKTRLLFDIFDSNSDRFLSQKEIRTILESAIKQTGIKVNCLLHKLYQE